MNIIRSENPQIDAEWLMDNVRAALGRKIEVSRPSGLNRDSLDNSRIDALISEIETRSRPRIHFPTALRRFPFSRSQWLQKFILKTYDLLFRDQRIINMSLALVLREMKNHHLRSVELIIQQQDCMADKLEKLGGEPLTINSGLSEIEKE